MSVKFFGTPVDFTLTDRIHDHSYMLNCTQLNFTEGKFSGIRQFINTFSCHFCFAISVS